MDQSNETSIFQKNPCLEADCPERAECCTTVRWRITERDFYDQVFREWWLLHEGARILEERGAHYIQWPMRCTKASEDGLRCTDYENRPLNCRHYTCERMAGIKQAETGSRKGAPGQ
ncbi:MAG: CxxCxxCC domain-containing protein [Candidatus Latescibacterota bacterium]